MLDKLTAMSAAACDGRRAWRTENSRDLYLGVDVQRYGALGAGRQA